MALDDFLSQIPLVGGMFDSGFGKAQDINQGLYNQFQQNKPTDVYHQYYNPQAYSYQTIQEDPALRQQQMQYLSKLSGLSDSGLSAQDQAGFTRASDLAGSQARQAREALQSRAEQMGTGGSGLNLALQDQANQNAMQTQAQMGQQQAAQSANQRALYNQAYGGALTGQRAQDFQANSANAGIINNFNQANTNQANQAQMYNQGNQYNDPRANWAAQQQYLQGMQQASQPLTNSYMQQSAANAAGRGANTAIGGALLGYGMYGGKQQGQGNGTSPMQDQFLADWGMF